MSDDHEYATNNDLSVIEDLIKASCNPKNIGSPSLVEPEGIVTKGRFGRKKEAAPEYTVAIDNQGEADQVLVMFYTPDQPFERFVNGELPIPAGWTQETSADDICQFLSTSRPDPQVTARWLVDTLVTLGATLPTGR